MTDYHVAAKDVYDAEQAAFIDLGNAQASPLWQEAIAFLRTELAPVAEEVRAAISTSPNDHHWIAGYHFGWGMAVRNLLRQHGFGEDDFRIDNLDNIYVELVEAAMATEQNQ